MQKNRKTLLKMRRSVCGMLKKTHREEDVFTQVLHTHTYSWFMYECSIIGFIIIFYIVYIFIQFFSFYLNEAKAQLQIGRAFVEQRDALAERIRWFFRQRQTEQTRSDGFFFHETPTARGDFIFFLFEMSQFD